MTTLNLNHLVITWSTSKGRDTYGWNICRLDDCQGRKRYKTIGGGYDMIGTVFGDWLEDYYQADLLELVKTLMKDPETFQDFGNNRITFPGLYGMSYYPNSGKVSLDGGCGITSMQAIARELGLEVEWEGNRKGHTTGYYVWKEVK